METWTDVERGVDNYFKEIEKARKQREFEEMERYFDEMELEEVD